MEIQIKTIDVHCDTCGAIPGEECTSTTPSGRRVGSHQDRRANATVIRRHLAYLASL